MIRDEAHEPRHQADAEGRIGPKGRVRWEPLLSADEERELADRIRGGDPSARKQLILANLRVVMEIARRFRGSKLPLDDLVQEGHLGLIRASADFDPAIHGCRFYTYAEIWIRAFIHRALVRNDSLIRIPEHVFLRRKQGRRARSTPARGGVAGDRPGGAGPAVLQDDAPEAGDAPPRLDPPGPSAPDRFAGPVLADDGEIVPLTDTIVDDHRPDQQAAEQEQRILLEVALRRLNPVEAWVIRERYGLYLPIPEDRDWSGRGPRAARRDRPGDDRGARADAPGPARAHFHRSYIDLAQACGLSRHRIVQVEQAALEKLRGALLPGLAPNP